MRLSLLGCTGPAVWVSDAQVDLLRPAVPRRLGARERSQLAARGEQEGGGGPIEQALLPVRALELVQQPRSRVLALHHRLVGHVQKALLRIAPRLEAPDVAPPLVPARDAD